MRFLLLETIADGAHEELAGAGEAVLAESPDASDLADLGGFVAVLTRGRGQVSRALLARMPDLRVVARCGVGLDNVDVEACTERGIAVLNAPGSLTVTVAEHTIGLMLAARRRIAHFADRVRAGAWEARTRYDGDECAGSTLGIVGLGDIGRATARIALALGMRVLASARSDKGIDGIEQTNLRDLLGRSDVISLHTALTNETRGLIGESELAVARPGALLVNTARADLVDREALLQALDGGELAGYAADCAEPDPPPTDDALMRHPRCLITPHVAGLTSATYRRMCVRVVRATLGLLDGTDFERACWFNAADDPASG